MVAELFFFGGGESVVNCARSTKPSKSPAKYKQMKVTMNPADENAFNSMPPLKC